MAKQADFEKMLSNIEPSKSTVEYISSVQNNLREYLKGHVGYSKIYVDSFLSGSYSKHTAIRPVKKDKKRDVDIIVVTGYSTKDDANEVMQELLDVLLEAKTYQTAKMQHHSIGIELASISIDVVPVVVDDSDDSLYWVGDSEEGGWTLSDPKGHKSWSTDINIENNRKYKPLVKLFKWWRRVNCPEEKRYPKGIALEKIIADNIGDSYKSMEDLFIETIGNIISKYVDYVDRNEVPYLFDPSEKISGNNLLDGYTGEDFSDFINELVNHSELLNEKGTGNETWREILGNEFPAEKQTSSNSNYLLCKNLSYRKKPIWPMSHGGAAFVTLTVVNQQGQIVEYHNNGGPLDKGYDLYFKACTGVKKPYTVYWQITNTGEEARADNCLRGNFELSDMGRYGKRESTAYTGSHSVQCYIIKDNVCVAKSHDYIINIA